MAITVRTYPESFNPVYNRIEMSCTSSNVASANFRFVFKLYIEDNLEATFKVNPDPDNIGYIDVSRFIASFIVEAIQDPTSTNMFEHSIDTPVRKFRIDVVEEFGTPPVEQEEGVVTGDDVYAWSASFPTHDWIDQKNESTAFNTWLSNTINGANVEFLTNYKTPKVSINDAGWITLLASTTSTVDYVKIVTKDSSGSTLQTVQVNNPLTMTTTEARMTDIAFAPETLNNYSGAFVSGAQPIITSSVATYTFQIFSSLNQPVSEEITVTIEEPCKFDQYRVHFLNELGGFDAFNFQARSQESSTATRKKYTRAKNYFDTNGAVEWNHRRNGTSDYLVKSRDKVKLRTDWLDEATQTWLKELIESPLVYLEFTDLQGNQAFKPVYVLTSNWTKQDLEIDKLFKLEIDIDLGHENFRQRR